MKIVIIIMIHETTCSCVVVFIDYVVVALWAIN